MMKTLNKIIFLLTMLITFSAGTTFAQNKLYLNPINLEPLTDARLELWIGNNFDCYGFQADLTIPNGLAINGMSINPDRVQAGDEYQLVYYQVEGVYKIGAFSTNHKAIVGSTGAFVFIDVFVTPDFRASDFIINNVKLINASDNHQANVEASSSTPIGVLPNTISLDPATKDLNKGETQQLTATFFPDYTTVRDLTWTSSEESIATVNQNGIVNAVYRGTATITATTPNEKTATSAINVLIPAEGIVIDKEAMTIERGSTGTLITSPIPEDTTDEITWTSSDESIATVVNGEVFGVEKGQAIITAKCGNYEAICKVTVKVTPTEILLDRESLYTMPGGTATLYATVLPADADYDKITWTSSDERIATVDENGNVTAIADGEATITAWCGSLSDSCIVYVIKDFIAATGISLSNTELLMREGHTAELIAIIHPENATDKSASWSSSDLSVATVDNKGIVTAIKQGVTIITASTANGHTATCTVTVVPVVVAVEAISLNKYDLTLDINETFNLIATITPSYASDTSVTWKSQDTSIATVSDDGLVTGVAAGNTIIYASSSNGLTVECNVTVLPGEIPVESISISQSKLFMREGYTSELFALIRPDDATDRNVVWSSSNPEIASVDQNGVVTANLIGEAIIYASSANGVYGICYVTVVPYITPVERIDLNKTAIEIDIEETYQLIATVSPEDASDKTITWKSLDRTIAIISEDGVVTGISAGITTIYASTSNGITVECQVTVRPEDIDPTGISLTNTELLLIVGDTAELLAIVRPDNATDKSVTWTSSDETIATVDENGIVTAIHQGFATITATTANGIIATCKVTVSIIPVESITLNKTSLEMKVDNKETLIATIKPDNATDKTVTWRSSNREVATVSENGLVTAVGLGTATIYASSSNGLTAECAVTVIPGIIPVTGISLSNTELLMREGYSTEILAIVHPDNATDKTVTWSTDNPAIATFDANEDKAVISAHAVGKATITVTSNFDPKIKAHCVVTVEKEADITAVESITLNKTAITLEEGEEEELIATITPDDATDKTVTWKSSDREIAIVDENGKVTAIKEGVAIIYASSSNGLTAECEVTVTPAYVEVTGISLSNTELLMREGHTSDLIAIIRPDNATDKSVTWTSSDESIATVDQNGIVTAIHQGYTTVSATSHNGLVANCYVTVVPDVKPVEGISVDPTTLEMEVDDTYKLTATITPDDASDKTITWRSSDRAIATVAEDGTVTAVSAGLVTIYASSSNGLTAECAVTVNPPYEEVISISLTNTELLMIEGDTTDLIAIVRPDNATDKTVIWSSSDESIVTVDQNGIVNAILQGYAVVSATASNGVKADCYVTVLPRIIAVESISISDSEIDIFVGDEYTLTASITPEDATDKTITWKSSNKAIATVSENGVVTGIEVGTAIIYASSSNGLTAECTVNVHPDIIEVESITLTNTELLMREGYTADLIAIISPDNATDKSVTWASTDEEIATVDQNGIVTAIHQGNTVVSATTNNGLQALCYVTVVPVVIAVEDILLSPTEITICEGEEHQLTATVIPDDATDKTITWKSTDRAVAIASEDGVVTGIKEGKATILASSSNGLTKECLVTVYARPLAPKQLLRKGDGTSCTFVVMMDLSDAELTALGYRFVYGYTDANGQTHVMEETPLRYTHTTSEIYNDPTNDFWAFSLLENKEGVLLNSDLRHLDGSLEVCFDAAKYGYPTKGDVSGVASIKNCEWLQITSKGLHIAPNGSENIHVEIYNMSGIQIFARTYDDLSMEGDLIEFSKFTPDTYVVLARSGEKVISKTIVIR